MVDIHTHILPGVDDGAKTVNDSLLLIDSLISQGVKDICLTSHFYPFETPLNEFCEKRKVAYEKLKASLGDRQIRLYLGAEVQYNDILFNNEDLSELCIEGTNFMLLELPYTDKFESTLITKVERFVDVYGIVPVIAHAERYIPIQKKPKLCADFKNGGCLIQVNSGSITERGREKRTVKRIIKEGLCDLLGSDCHNIDFRPANMEKAMEALAKKYGEEICGFFRDNAQDVLNNRLPGY